MKRTFLVVVAAAALLSPLVQTLDAPASGASVVAASVTRAAFTSGTSAKFVEGTSGSFRIAVAKGPVVFSFVGKLPLGLALVPAGDGLTAALSGVPEVGTAGTYAVKLTARNVAGGTTQKLTVHVAAIGATVPVVTGVFGSGLAGSTLKIEGKNLANALQVHVGSGLAKLVTDTATTVVARAPALPNGLVSVRVTTKAGTSPLSFEDLLDVQSVPAAPTVTSATASGLGVVVEWRQAAAADEVTFVRAHRRSRSRLRRCCPDRVRRAPGRRTRREGAGRRDHWVRRDPLRRVGGCRERRRLERPLGDRCRDAARRPGS